MEQINVAKILENAPKELKLYSDAYGEVVFDSVFDFYNGMVIKCFKAKDKDEAVYFDKYGKLDSNGKVMLLPKNNWNWNAWYVLIKNGDFVLVKDIANNLIITKHITETTAFGERIQFVDIHGSAINVTEIISWATKEQIESYERAFFDIHEVTKQSSDKDFEFKPFDKVLTRNDQNIWYCNIFSHYEAGLVHPYCCIDYYHKECIPYNDNTKHLLGTTNPYLE